MNLYVHRIQTCTEWFTSWNKIFQIHTLIRKFWLRLKYYCNWILGSQLKLGNFYIRFWRQVTSLQFFMGLSYEKTHTYGNTCACKYIFAHTVPICSSRKVKENLSCFCGQLHKNILQTRQPFASWVFWRDHCCNEDIHEVYFRSIFLSASIGHAISSVADSDPALTQWFLLWIQVMGKWHETHLYSYIQSFALQLSILLQNWFASHYGWQILCVTSTRIANNWYLGVPWTQWYCIKPL